MAAWWLADKSGMTAPLERLLQSMTHELTLSSHCKQHVIRVGNVPAGTGWILL